MSIGILLWELQVWFPKKGFGEFFKGVCVYFFILFFSFLFHFTYSVTRFVDEYCLIFIFAELHNAYNTCKRTIVKCHQIYIAIAQVQV